MNEPIWLKISTFKVVSQAKVSRQIASEAEVGIALGKNSWASADIKLIMDHQNFYGNFIRNIITSKFSTAIIL